MGPIDVNVESSQARAVASQRWDAVDVARGLAILSMIVFRHVFLPCAAAPEMATGKKGCEDMPANDPAKAPPL